jgi:hypothetical protein
MTTATTDRIEMLSRNLARHQIIISLLSKKQKCDESEKPCDICYGFDLAIKLVQDQLEPEN